MKFILTLWECSGCHTLELTKGQEPLPCGRVVHDADFRWQITGEVKARNPNEEDTVSEAEKHGAGSDWRDPDGG